MNNETDYRMVISAQDDDDTDTDDDDENDDEEAATTDVPSTITRRKKSKNKTAKRRAMPSTFIFGARTKRSRSFKTYFMKGPKTDRAIRPPWKHKVEKSRFQYGVQIQIKSICMHVLL